MTTVVIGAGHSGLAMSRCLSERSIDHVAAMAGFRLFADLDRDGSRLELDGYSSELIGKDFGHGNTAFLAKPYMPRQLARLVRECLDKPLKTGDSVLPEKTPA